MELWENCHTLMNPPYGPVPFRHYPLPPYVCETHPQHHPMQNQYNMIEQIKAKNGGSCRITRLKFFMVDKVAVWKNKTHKGRRISERGRWSVALCVHRHRGRGHKLSVAQRVQATEEQMRLYKHT